MNQTRCNHNELTKEFYKDGLTESEQENYTLMFLVFFVKKTDTSYILHYLKMKRVFFEVVKHI